MLTMRGLKLKASMHSCLIIGLLRRKPPICTSTRFGLGLEAFLAFACIRLAKFTFGGSIEEEEEEDRSFRVYGADMVEVVDQEVLSASA